VPAGPVRGRTLTVCDLRLPSPQPRHFAVAGLPRAEAVSSVLV